jgi:multiple sugar transport system permease protein
MIPGILTLIPAFVLTHQLGIWNTPLALILPWTAGGQVLGIFLCCSFIAGLPEELFEAGCIDGAGEFLLWYRVAPSRRTCIHLPALPRLAGAQDNA